MEMFTSGYSVNTSLKVGTRLGFDQTLADAGVIGVILLVGMLIPAL